MSKNIFNIMNDTIYISRTEWDFMACATVREDYLEEIQSVTWSLNGGRYLYNSKLGYLHSYIIEEVVWRRTMPRNERKRLCY